MKASSRYFAAIAGLFIACFATAAGAGPIDRVEPPFWWQGFQHNELQIMIHGHGTAAFDVSIDHPGVTLGRVERVESENYLFLYVTIDDSAKPGSFDIVLENEEFRVAHEYELREKKAGAAHVKGFTPADAIYLITPDRYANGDPDNDTVEGLEDEPDRSDDYGRHGGDLAGIRNSLEYIHALGFTAIWLNPVLENAMPEASYHGYATTDFYKVDPRFGSNAQYRKLARRMKAQGMGLIMDMIVNHAGREHWWMDDLPSSDWLNYSATVDDADALVVTSHARTTNQDPYASEHDKTEFADGWFDYAMPDLNQRNPLLADYLIQNAIWWTEYLGLAGIRMDTYPYPDKQFMSEWTRRIMQEYPNLNVTGEEWSPNPAIVSYWQRGKQNHDGYESSLPSVLDFPLQIAFIESLLAPEPDWGSVWTPAYEMLGNDFLYPEPFNLVIFPDNHDMSRIFTQVDENYELFRMAMVYYATMRGIPAFYYGTEVLMSHPGTTSHGAIREEFPGGWSDHDKNAFNGAGLTDVERDAQQFVRRLLNWRKDKSVIHGGQLMQFAPVDGVYVYFRYSEQDTVMVVLNRSDEVESIKTSRFAERLGDSRFAEDVISGKRYNIATTITISPHTAMILEVEQR